MIHVMMLIARKRELARGLTRQKEMVHRQWLICVALYD